MINYVCIKCGYELPFTRGVCPFCPKCGMGMFPDKRDRKIKILKRWEKKMKEKNNGK